MGIATNLRSKIHVIIGDTQTRPGVPTDHLEWIGRYIVEQFAGLDITIVHLGDHADMPSLSSYDKGKRSMEGRRYKEDIKAANAGWARLCTPLKELNKGRRHQWWPERVITLGNHEDRITRACEDDAQLEGILSLDDLDYKKWGWTVVPFLEPFERDGVHFSHYWYHPSTGRPYGGENLYTRLKQIGHTFVQGHQQGMGYAVRPVGKVRHHGLVLGSTYLHQEKYLGPQSHDYWRGICVLHQVENGMFDPMFISLDYLCRRFEHQTLREFMQKYS